ncbi:MAG: hypothetical protein HDS71_07035 [Bacteroidales bacterium]|nr:hypothetical protein [Bacteroidales bacterium]MBD5223786.1 hypothetical protein [Bacteroidales bacterium]
MKFIYLFIPLFLLCACSKSEPWIGEYKPTNGDNAIIEFVSNGTVVYNQKSDDGSILIYGSWHKDTEEKREVSFKFDPSTIKIQVYENNPLTEAILYVLANEFTSKEITFQFSEDYKKASVDGDEENGYIKISSGSGQFDNVTPPTANETPVNDTVVKVEDVHNIVEEQAEKDLLRCYYSKKMLSGNGDYGNYSNEMKKTFSSKGINTSIEKPFTKSFQDLIDRAEEIGTEYNDVIIDSDLLFGGQDIPGNFNIEITGINVKDNDHVLINAKVTNYNNTQSRKFLMIRENDTFKIDDIDDGKSTRKWLQDEIKRVQQYQESNTQDYETYRGKVGEYDIEMKLCIGPEAAELVRCCSVEGSYKYIKAGNTLKLSGTVEMWPGLNQDDPEPASKYPIYVMTETTASGKESGEWVLYTGEDTLYGHLTTKGKTFKAKLKRVS